MNNPSICLIGVYFGSFPNYFDLWKLSVLYNPTIDFVIVTDQTVNEPIPKNLKIIKSDLKQFHNLTEKKLNMPVKMATPYKICDYKPLYGQILEDYISDYNYWGEFDFDVIFGDLRSYFTKYNILDYDKFLNRGHLTLYRNTKEITDRYKLSGGLCGSYKEIFSSDLVWGLDEMNGINKIYEKHNLSEFNKMIAADIQMFYYDLRLVDKDFTNYENQVFCWENGKIKRYYIEKENIKNDEFIYIHLAKRKFPLFDFDVKSAEKFMINPEGFTLYSSINKDIIKNNNIKDRNNTVVRKHKTSRFDKKMKFFWLGRRYLNLKAKINKR